MLKVDRFVDEAIVAQNSIKKNQWIQLGDLLNEDIKKTKYWDLKIENPLNICIPSENDFKTVFFCKESKISNDIKIYSNLHRLFSLSYFKIEKIGKIKDKFFIKTKYLWIDIEKALSNNELIIINNTVTHSELDVLFLERILDTYEIFEYGVLPKQELLRTCRLDYALYINQQKKWKINNPISIFEYY